LESLCTNLESLDDELAAIPFQLGQRQVNSSRISAPTKKKESAEGCLRRNKFKNMYLVFHLKYLHYNLMGVYCLLELEGTAFTDLIFIVHNLLKLNFEIKRKKKQAKLNHLDLMKHKIQEKELFSPELLHFSSEFCLLDWKSTQLGNDAPYRYEE